MAMGLADNRPCGLTVPGSEVRAWEVVLSLPGSEDPPPSVEPYLLLRLLTRPRTVARRHVGRRWRRRAAVVAGGALGTGLRAAVAAAMPVDPSGWPWGTLLANLSGALLLGYLLTRFQAAAPRATLTIPLLCTGLLGGYTTFATFAVEVAALLRPGRVAVGLLYGAVSVVAGVVVAGAGIRLAGRRS